MLWPPALDRHYKRGFKIHFVHHHLCVYLQSDITECDQKSSPPYLIEDWQLVDTPWYSIQYKNGRVLYSQRLQVSNAAGSFQECFQCCRKIYSAHPPCKVTIMRLKSSDA